MGLNDLAGDIETAYAELGAELSVELDTETRNELAMLESAYDPDDTDELLRRAIHVLFRNAVETGNLDFHLRSGYDVTYDEYLMNMTMDTYNQQQGTAPPEPNDDRRYQF